MTQPPKDYPITGACVVADPAKCPPGYDLIYYSYDKRDDCDLWKDSFFKAKVTRYLCITRIFPLDAGRLNNVLTDVVIQTEREIPPSGFTLLEKTIDTCEKSMTKKQVCVKMQPRDTTLNAITDLIILSRSKRAPPGFTLAGEINNLLLCFKLGTVPASTQKVTSAGNNQPNKIELTQSFFSSPQSASPQSTAQPYFQGSWGQQWGYGMPTRPAPPTPVATNTADNRPPVPPRTLDNHQGNGPVTKDASSPPKHALSGVPFHLNPAFQSAQDVKSMHNSEVSYRSQVDINGEYSYPFTLERSSAVRRLDEL